MLVLEHMRQLVKACYPCDQQEALRLWSDIKPIKYGNVVSWEAAQDYILAQYQIPDDASMHVVLRVECYTVNETAGAADFGAFEPPPPGFAHWRLAALNLSTTYDQTSTQAPTQRLLDADEFLLFRSGFYAELIGSFAVSPDGDTRDVRTLVYGYNVGAAVADRIGRGEMEIPTP